MKGFCFSYYMDQFSIAFQIHISWFPWFYVSFIPSRKSVPFSYNELFFSVPDGHIPGRRCVFTRAAWALLYISISFPRGGFHSLSVLISVLLLRTTPVASGP